MRTLGAIGAAVLMMCAVPVAGRADGPAPVTASERAAPGCKCPGVQRRAWKPRRVVRHHRRGPPPLAVAAPSLPPAYYNPGIPSPYDTAYNRAMVLHFRSPPVSGLYQPEPGYPPTPPVVGVQPYRVQTGSVVMQYDGLTGEYIQLAASDPSHEFAASAAPSAGAPPHQH
jgi:hypothetical protein